MSYKDLGIEKYELDDWLPQFGCEPVKRHFHADYGGSYEMEVMHVFELENGQFATVYESGCSCYSSSDAEIDLHPNLEAAKKKFDEWERKHKNL